MPGRSSCGFTEVSEEGHLGGGAGTQGSTVGTSSHGGKEVSDGGWHGGRRHCARSGGRGGSWLLSLGSAAHAFLKLFSGLQATSQLCYVRCQIRLGNKRREIKNLLLQSLSDRKFCNLQNTGVNHFLRKLGQPGFESWRHQLCVLGQVTPLLCASVYPSVKSVGIWKFHPC